MPKRLQIEIGDASWTAEVSGDRVTLQPGEGGFTVTRDAGRLRMNTGAREYAGNAIAAGDTVWVSVDGEVFAVRTRYGVQRTKSTTRDHDAFTPPMSATVVRIAVTPGDAVKDGDVLIALEAMKMELPIRAPRDGVVTAVHCREGDLVQPGDVLLDLD